MHEAIRHSIWFIRFICVFWSCVHTKKNYCKWHKNLNGICLWTNNLKIIKWLLCVPCNAISLIFKMIWCWSVLCLFRRPISILEFFHCFPDFTYSFQLTQIRYFHSGKNFGITEKTHIKSTLNDYKKSIE